jgi:hypothetical protein
MVGSTIQSMTSLGQVPTNWFVVATGDFNADGKGDILWQDTQGNLAIWFMNGAQVIAAQAVGKLPANWVVVQADRNGWIFLRNTVTNEVGIWVMQGNTVAQAMDFGAVPAQWSIAGIGDFDNNGFSDILWRDASGNVAIWLLRSSLAGPQIASLAVLGNVSTKLDDRRNRRFQRRRHGRYPLGRQYRQRGGVVHERHGHLVRRHVRERRHELERPVGQLRVMNPLGSALGTRSFRFRVPSIFWSTRGKLSSCSAGHDPPWIATSLGRMRTSRPQGLQ